MGENNTGLEDLPDGQDGSVARMIQALCDLEDGLSDWEVEFVESVSHQDLSRLSIRQISKIEELFEKHC